MIVVADTSPLNYLIRLGYVNALKDIYGEVVVPPAVLQEMLHDEAPPEVRHWALHPPSWLAIRSVSSIDQTLSSELGAGEREAISLAIEINADLLLIDERLGRYQAESRKVQVAGTLAVLLQASLLYQVDFVESLKRLRQFGFRLSNEVEQYMLDRYRTALQQK